MSDTSTGGVAALLGELARRGVRLRLVDGDRIEVSAAAGAFPPDLRDAVVRHKPELLDSLRAARTPPAARLPRITIDREHLFEPFPASDLQQSFLIGSREGFEYYVRPHQYMEFDFDELDPRRFEQALNRVVRRHRNSVVVLRDDLRLETVRDPAPLTIAVDDLRHLSAEEAARSMERTRADMRRTEPAYDRWPWLEPRISLYGGNRARLHYNNNNIFTDAPSGAALITEALRLYREPAAELPRLELSYRDCVLALAELEDSPLGQTAQRYWLERMGDWPTAPQIPLVSGTEHRKRSMMHRRELVFPAPLWAAVRRGAEARGLTPTNVLLGAHAEVLAYWSGSRHFLLNNMISHRPIPLHPDMEQVLGNFASLYPLEVDWRHEESFHARVRRLQARLIADVEHLYWSGSKVLQALNRLRRTPGRAVCPFAVGSALFVGPADRPFYSMLETPQTLLDTEFWELRDGQLLVVWDVIEAMFPDGLIDAMFDGYRRVVEDLAQDGAWEREAFELLPQAQRTQRAAINRATRRPPAGLLHAALAAHASRRPDKPAVRTAATTLDYAHLHRRSTRLAELLHGHGAGPGDLVAVMLPKGPDQVVAVCAVLQAGAAYVPIDPQWPLDRIRFLLGDTAARAVVTDQAHRDLVTEAATVPVVEVDGPAAAAAPSGIALPVQQPGELAYVIYTSGSTGRPKGAMLDHRGPLNTIADVNERFGIAAHDVLFAASSLGFDLSVYDVFGALAAGATLVMPTAAHTDPASWPQLAATHGVTVWNSVPALMELFTEAAEAAGLQLPALRVVLLSGDWIPVTLPDRVRRIAPNARVISLGGATEGSIWSICFPIDDQDPQLPSIPYGKPLNNQAWHVLDERGRDAPVWVPGELYIGGAGVALGYLNDPKRTDAAFVPHPRTGERLYRTGDLGRYLPSGDIEFLGRADFQVKIQGFRVEPGEVEHALLEHPDVAGAAVVARRSGSGLQLAGFVVGAAARHDPEPSVLRDFLAARLPSYLVPSRIRVLAELPLTANGKVDRKALERLDPSPAEGGRVQALACTPTQAALQSIWESVLSVTPIGIHDDFFDLGGQSFAALRVSALIAERLGQRVPLGTLLERRTVAELAGWLDAPERSWSPLARLREGKDEMPCFFVHPAGGNVVCYRALAERMTRPFFAFQAPGPAGGREPLDDVDQMAELYLAALLEARPHGPYLLGGWSSGAIVAYAMARKLRERGEPVAALVVVDAPAPVAPRELDEVEALLWFLEDLGLGFSAARADAGTRRALARLRPELRLGRALDLLREHGVSGPGLDPEQLSAAFAVFRGVVRGCNAYRAEPIDTGIAVIRARQAVVSEFAGHPAADAADWGWSALTTGSVATTALPGTHHTLLVEQHSLGAVAEVIDAVARDVPTAGSPSD